MKETRESRQGLSVADGRRKGKGQGKGEGKGKGRGGQLTRRIEKRRREEK